MDQLANLIPWAQAHIETIVFYLLAMIAIPMALGVVLDRVIIRSGFILIGVFGAISGLFMILQAQFIAMAQVMIYAVGITLVVVIALMLTNPKSEKEESPEIPRERVPGVLVGCLVFVTIYAAIRSSGVWLISHEPVSANNVQAIGKGLLTSYALPFEFSSVLLLAALIGAVMLAKAEPPVARPESEDKLPGQSRERTNDVVKV